MRKVSLFIALLIVIVVFAIIVPQKVSISAQSDSLGVSITAPFVIVAIFLILFIIGCSIYYWIYWLILYLSPHVERTIYYIRFCLRCPIGKYLKSSNCRDHCKKIPGSPRFKRGY